MTTRLSPGPASGARSAPPSLLQTREGRSARGRSTAGLPALGYTLRMPRLSARFPARLSRLGVPSTVLWIAAAPAQAASDAQVQVALARFNEHAHYRLPSLSAAQRQRLLAGEVVKVIDEAPDGSGSRRAVGLVLTPASRDAMWLACQDLHFVQSEAVHEYRMSLTAPDRSRWYGIVDLPRPFSDRHYVVDVWNNHELAQQTGNLSWERPWSLVPGAVTEARGFVEAGKVPKTDLSMWQHAVETPTNLGAWVAIALPDGSSIFGYHAATRVGGNIPEGLMLQYVKATLDTTLLSIADRAQAVIPQHYTDAHEDVWGGDGRRVPTVSR